jgi:RNA polymerase sigma-70 factor (ECF subfamily)
VSIAIQVNRAAVHEARDLSARLAAGHLSALAALYDRYGGAVYRLALAIVREEPDAEDVLQEVFLELLRTPRDLRDPRAYLLAAARRRAVSVLRRRRTKNTHADRTIALLDSTALDPADAAAARQIEHALGRLPVEQRQVVVLRIYEGLSFAEIARIVRTNANTAASRYRYGIARLRELVGDGI